MKNAILIMALIFTAVSYGQRGEKRMEARQSMTPQQEASIKSKKMALHLDLSEKQQNQVYDLLLEQAKDRPKKMTKEEREKMSEEDRIAQMEARLDQQIATKRELKKVLSVEQFEKFETTMNKRKKGAKERLKKRRQDR